jgi:hypothetical protein
MTGLSFNWKNKGLLKEKNSPFFIKGVDIKRIYENILEKN